METSQPLCPLGPSRIKGAFLFLNGNHPEDSSMTTPSKSSAPASTTQAATQAVEPPAQTTLPCLKTASASKLSKRAEGSHIHYRLWCDPQHAQLFVQIYGNDGGGQHSLELVPFAKVQAAMASVQDGQAFKARILRSAFKGRSANNSGFLACALRAEGLFSAADDKAFAHVVCGDWKAWLHACLSLPGEQKEIAVTLVAAALPADTGEATSSSGGKAKAKGRTRDTAQEDGNAPTP
jgi:hypothetical protein